MKYTKPSVYGFQRNRISTEILSFLDSLPAEFEILEPGMTQVKWPEECTKDAMNRAARYLSYNAGNTEGAAKHMLFVLAAIAPVEKRKRKVALWVHESWGTGFLPAVTAIDNDLYRDGRGGWRKVGECEVDA